MPAKTNTAPTALGGTKPSPDEPASNRAMKDHPAMARIPRLSPQPAAAVMPGLDPGIHALPSRHSRNFSAMPHTPRHSRASRSPRATPAWGTPEPAPLLSPGAGSGPNRGPPTQPPETLSEMTPPVSAFPAIPGTAHQGRPSGDGTHLAAVPASKETPMTFPRAIPPREILFVDPGVADIATILGHLRPEVEAILLDPVRPAAHQIAAAAVPAEISLSAPWGGESLPRTRSGGRGEVGAAPGPQQPPQAVSYAAAAATPAREILSLDPGVSGIATLLGHLRPEVEAILLDPVRPAAHQMAAALAGEHDLAAIHIVAHGAPGRVDFAAGQWSAETVADDAEDLAAIGRALAASGDLRLWSCRTAAGPAGAAFVAGLTQASGADTAAATGLVGATALGGGWELGAVAQPPLTMAGVAGYAGVFSVTLTSRGRGERLTIFGRWPAGTKAGTYFIVWDNSGTLEVLGKFIVPVGGLAGTFAISEPLPAGTYTVGPPTPGPGTIAVYNGKWNESGPAAGTWSVSDFNPTITATLNDTRNIPPNEPSSSGVVS
jgi:Domain of unknown function (DUF4347)